MSVASRRVAHGVGGGGCGGGKSHARAQHAVLAGESGRVRVVSCVCMEGSSSA